MANFQNNSITEYGRLLLAEVQAGAVFIPTRIVLGSGNLPAGKEPTTMTDVVSPVKDLNINKKEKTPDGKVVFGGAYDNQGVTKPFYLRELALYARAEYRNEDGSVKKAVDEVLYSYGNAGATADYMPAYSTETVVEKQLDIVVYVGNSAKVELTIASGTAMTVEMGEQMVDGLRKEVGQALEGKAEKTHKHTSEDITGLDEAMSGALEGKADKEHTHTKKDITDFPESMPASDVYDWAKQPNKPVYTAEEVGAAPSGHTHNDRYYTEAEINGKLSGYATAAQLNEVKKAMGGWKLLNSFSENIIGSSYQNNTTSVKPIIPMGINIKGIKAIKQVTKITKAAFSNVNSHTPSAIFGTLGPILYGRSDYSVSAVSNLLYERSAQLVGMFRPISSTWIAENPVTTNEMGHSFGVSGDGSLLVVTTDLNYNVIAVSGNNGVTSGGSMLLNRSDTDIRYSIELYGLF